MYIARNNMNSTIELAMYRAKYWLNAHGSPEGGKMILDMIEQNDWERPIYFAITIGDPKQNAEPFLFLHNYRRIGTVKVNCETTPLRLFPSDGKSNGCLGCGSIADS